MRENPPEHCLSYAMKPHRALPVACFVAAAFLSANLHAQQPSENLSISPAQSTTPSVASPFLLEPEVEIKGDRIKRETYRSQPAGQNQNWNLDIGRFQPKIDEDPNNLIEDDKQGYSGMRLRLPLRGGLQQ